MSDSSSKNTRPSLSDEVLTMRKRALANLVITPLLLTGMGVGVYLGWRVSLIWATTTDLITKIWIGIGAISLIVLEAGLGFFTMKFVRWALAPILANRKTDSRKISTGK